MRMKTKGWAALNLHDAIVRTVRIIRCNYISEDVIVCLDCAASMEKIKKLRLIGCTKLEMDAIEGCWWMGETICFEDNSVVLDVWLKDEKDEERKLRAICQQISAEDI